jgi:hypothetical protein
VLLASGDRNGGLFVWEAHTAREYFSLRAHTACITDVSWRADANALASASEDTTVRLWEMENGGNFKGWGAHGGGVQAVKYAKDGRLVSVGRDRVPKMWDQNGAQQRAFEATPDVTLRVAFTHDAGRVIAGDWSGLVRVWNTADGKPLGNLLANPPTVAERFDAATKELAQRDAAHKQLTAAYAASKPAADKLSADLATARQTAADTATAAKIVAESLPRFKEPADKANAALAAAQAQVAGRDVVARAYAEAAAKIKDAADKAKGNAELAAAAAKAQEQAKQAAAELAAAQGPAAELAKAAQAANEAFAAAQRAAAFTANQAAVAAKQVETLTPPATAAVAKANAEKAALDQATGALTVAKAEFEKWKAALPPVKQAQR